MGNTIDGGLDGGPDPVKRLVLEILGEMANGNIFLRAPSEAVHASEAALEDSDFFHAQYNAYDAKAIIEGDEENKDKNVALLERADKVLESVREKSPAPKLNPRDVLTYNKPIQIGSCLWICKEDDWPPLAVEQIKPSVGYAILDLDSLTSVDGEYIGLKALRDGETVELEKIIGDRISQDSAFPNGDVKVIREGDTIRVLSPQEVSQAVKKILDSGMAGRIRIAKLALQNQLGDNLPKTDAERQQMLTDIAALEAKLGEIGTSEAE